MTGGKVSKINGKWDFDLRNGRKKSVIEKVLAYQGLEIEVLNDLAAECEETNSNEYLKTTQLQDEFKRRCDAATTPLEYEALKALKSKISEIIHLRTEEGFDKFDPFEDAAKKTKREGHEYRVKLWSEKYTIIKKDLNDVRRRLNQKPEIDIVFLEAQLGTLSAKKKFVEGQLEKIVANIAHIDEHFGKAIPNLEQLQLFLSHIPTDVTAKSAALEENKDQLSDIHKMLTDLFFRFQDPLFDKFNKDLENISSKTPEQMGVLSTSLAELISHLANGSKIYTDREQVIRGILASIDQEQQALQSDAIEDKAEAEREGVSTGEVSPPIGVASPGGVILKPAPDVDLTTEVATRNVQYIAVLDAIMNELEKAAYIGKLKELIDRTISRTDIDERDKVTLVFYMRAVLFANAIDILTIVAHLSIHDSDYLRKPLSVFYAVKDPELQSIIQRFKPDETAESLLQEVTKNMCDGITDILSCFYVFMYYLYQYLHLSPPNLEVLPKIAKFDDIKRAIEQFERLKPVYVKDILQIFSGYQVYIKAHLPFFKQKFKSKFTDTFLMKEAMDAERKVEPAKEPAEEPEQGKLKESDKKNKLARLIESKKAQESILSKEVETIATPYDGYMKHQSGEMQSKMGQIDAIMDELVDLPETNIEKRAELQEKINGIKSTIGKSAIVLNELEKNLYSLKIKKKKINELKEMIRKYEERYATMSGGLSKRKRPKKTRRAKR